MKKESFFTINWYQINKHLETSEGRGLIRSQMLELKSKIDKKISEKNIEESTKKENDRIKLLKSLPAGSKLWYYANSKELPYATELKKKKDGRTYMLVSAGDKLWRVSYKNIKDVEPDQVNKEINKIARQVFLK